MPNTARLIAKRVLVSVLLIIWLACVGFSYSVFGARYEILTVPAPDKSGWSYQQTAIQTWEEGSQYYLWRVQTYVTSGFTRQSLIDYFDKWFADEGWIKVGVDDPPTCGATFPEANFFEPDPKRGYIIYRHKTDQYWYIGPQACLVIWGDVGFWYIVLQTENPSFWTAIIKSM